MAQGQQQFATATMAFLFHQSAAVRAAFRHALQAIAQPSAAQEAAACWPIGAPPGFLLTLNACDRLWRPSCKRLVYASTSTSTTSDMSSASPSSIEQKPSRSANGMLVESSRLPGPRHGVTADRPQSTDNSLELSAHPHGPYSADCVPVFSSRRQLLFPCRDSLLVMSAQNRQLSPSSTLVSARWTPRHGIDIAARSCNQERENTPSAPLKSRVT